MITDVCVALQTALYTVEMLHSTGTRVRTFETLRLILITVEHARSHGNHSDPLGH